MPGGTGAPARSHRAQIREVNTMQRIKNHRLVLTVVAVCALLLGATATPAAGSPTSSPTADRVAQYLAAHPGGVPINDNEISYGDGAFIVTIEAPGQTDGIADCPRGWFCFYDRPSFGYPRGKLSSCGQQDLSAWAWQFRTESVHYNLSSGFVVFHYYNVALFQVSVSNRALADVTPNRNWANVVTRYC